MTVDVNYLRSLYDFLRDPSLRIAFDELEKLREENKQLKDALIPFAKLTEALVDKGANIAIGLTENDFINARSALKL